MSLWNCYVVAEEGNPHIQGVFHYSESGLDEATEASADHHHETCVLRSKKTGLGPFKYSTFFDGDTMVNEKGDVIRRHPDLREDQLALTEVAREGRTLMEYDDLAAFLWSGRNVFGEPVIGVLVKIDFNTCITRIRTIIVSEESYWNFLSGGKSYLTILKEAKKIFNEERGHSPEWGRRGRQIILSEIPDGEMPTDDSFLSEEVVALYLNELPEPEPT